jgi:hypothetical protein
MLIDAGARTELVQNPFRKKVEEILVTDKLFQDVHTFGFPCCECAPVEK